MSLFSPQNFSPAYPRKFHWYLLWCITITPEYCHALASPLQTSNSNVQLKISLPHWNNPHTLTSLLSAKGFDVPFLWSPTAPWTLLLVLQHGPKVDHHWAANRNLSFLCSSQTLRLFRVEWHSQPTCQWVPEYCCKSLLSSKAVTLCPQIFRWHFI